MESVDKSDRTGNDRAYKPSVPLAEELQVSTPIADDIHVVKAAFEQRAVVFAQAGSAKWQPQGLRASDVRCQISSQVHAAMNNDTLGCDAIPCHILKCMPARARRRPSDSMKVKLACCSAVRKAL